jgi:DNA-binding transcriptional ArsR family regulator
VIRFHLPAARPGRLAFAYSPLQEAVLSLHVLVEPRHHPLQHEWVLRMRRLPDRLRREIHAFAFAYRGYIPEVVAPSPSGGSGTFADDLARLRTTPPEDVASEFSVPLAGGSALGRETGRLLRLLLDDPAAFLAAFADFLERYWHAGFEHEWERIEPLVAAAVDEAERELAEQGLYAYLSRLSAELFVDAAAQTFTVDRRHEHEVFVDAATTLTLTPSVYVWPHVRVNCDAPWPLGLVYPAPAIARASRSHLPPEELLRVLRALADPARLEMLRLIAIRPRSTQELAQLVNMTEGGVSRSLRLLGQAGVLATRRRGRYLLYRLVPDRLDLDDSLRRFLAER